MSLNPSRAQEALENYLVGARGGDRDTALFGLIELDHSVLPLLQAAYRSEPEASIRALLVEAIWQHRQQSVVPFLFEALKDADDETWMQALDGLVALASPTTRDGLESALGVEADARRREWFTEALDQIRQAITQPDHDAQEGLTR
ncbi:MAG TPA: HEAT repeat domain-containing protein [Planctomycetaceae bacterium]|nr:HEAT repeat domain-containing protein [Planctomycetaceae bacterium]